MNAVDFFDSLMSVMLTFAMVAFCAMIAFMVFLVLNDYFADIKLYAWMVKPGKRTMIFDENLYIHQEWPNMVLVGKFTNKYLMEAWLFVTKEETLNKDTEVFESDFPNATSPESICFGGAIFKVNHIKDLKGISEYLMESKWLSYSIEKEDYKELSKEKYFLDKSSVTLKKAVNKLKLSSVFKRKLKCINLEKSK